MALKRPFAAIFKCMNDIRSNAEGLSVEDETPEEKSARVVAMLEKEIADTFKAVTPEKFGANSTVCISLMHDAMKKYYSRIPASSLKVKEPVEETFLESNEKKRGLPEASSVVDDSGETVKDDSRETVKDDSGETVNDCSGETVKDDSGETVKDDSGETVKDNEPVHAYGLGQNGKLAVLPDEPIPAPKSKKAKRSNKSEPPVKATE